MPQLPPDDDKSTGLLIEVYFLLVLASLLVVIRGYAKLRITKNWGWDDLFIFLSWLFLVAESVIIQVAVDRGYGRHLIYLPDPERDAYRILSLIPFFQIITILCTLATKISISIYLLRIKNDRRMKWALSTLMLLISLATLAAIIVVCVVCVPLRKLWTPELPGHCISFQAVNIVGYIQAGLTIFVDLCLTATPLYIVWGLKIDRRKKALIFCLMSLGLTATASTAAKPAYISALSSPDFTCEYKMPCGLAVHADRSADACTPLTIVSVLEASAGIIAACIPTCVPVLRLHKLSSTKGTGRSSIYLNSISKNSKFGTRNSRQYKSIEGNQTSEASLIRTKEVGLTTVTEC